MSDTVGERPSRCDRVLVASLMSSLSSWSRRGTRMSQVRSRKCRLISPTMVGTAVGTAVSMAFAVTVFLPHLSRVELRREAQDDMAPNRWHHDGHDTEVVRTSGRPCLEHHHDPSRVGNWGSSITTGVFDLTC